MRDLVNRGRHPADPTGELYGDTHWPLPNYYDREPTMHIAINREKMTFICLGEYRVAWAKALDEVAPEAIVIGEAASSRTYSKFTDMELKLLYRNTTGFQHEGFDYNAMLQSCKVLGLKLEPLPTPPGLVRLPNRPTPETPAPTPRKAPVARAEGATPTPTPRPKPGTATGRVWDIADEVLAAMPDADHKALRAEIVKRATADGINPATVQVQYGKWKGSKNQASGG